VEGFCEDDAEAGWACSTDRFLVNCVSGGTGGEEGWLSLVTAEGHVTELVRWGESTDCSAGHSRPRPRWTSDRRYLVYGADGSFCAGSADYLWVFDDLINPPLTIRTTQASPPIYFPESSPR
jgi:hypothetical protein